MCTPHCTLYGLISTWWHQPSTPILWQDTAITIIKKNNLRASSEFTSKGLEAFCVWIMSSSVCLTTWEHDISGITLRECLQSFHKHLLGVKDALIRFWWSDAKVQGHCDLLKHMFRHDTRILTAKVKKHHISNSRCPPGNCLALPGSACM